MQTLETLRRRIDSTQSLHSVVRTMKALSMASIRQCEEAAEALSDYYRTIQLGLQIALRHRPHEVPDRPAGAASRVGALVFGSTWGMCGRFNEQLARAVADHLAALDVDGIALMTFGEYIEGPLEMVGYVPDQQYAGPESAEGITRRVQEVLVHLEVWRNTQAMDRIVLFYNTLTSGTHYNVA